MLPTPRVSAAYVSASHPEEGLLVSASGMDLDSPLAGELVDSASSSQPILAIPTDPWVYIEAAEAYETALDEGLRAFLARYPEPDTGFVQLWYRPNATGELVVAWRVVFTSMADRAGIDVTIDAATGEVIEVKHYEESG